MVRLSVSTALRYWRKWLTVIPTRRRWIRWHGRAFSVWALAATPFLLGLPANAQFTFTDDGISVTLIDYSGPGGDVTVPSPIKGLPVTSIGNNAFYNCTTLTNVTLPATVTNIGSQAFQFCSRMTNASVPGSLKTIGSYAFAFCSSLTAAPIPGSVTNLGSNAFQNCSKITSCHHSRRRQES